MNKDHVEKIIAGACFPSNPDMSGDPRKRLSPNQMRRVETAAEEVIRYFENYVRGGVDR
jgi:hypothetical protein